MMKKLIPLMFILLFFGCKSKEQKAIEDFTGYNVEIIEIKDLTVSDSIDLFNNNHNRSLILMINQENNRIENLSKQLAAIIDTTSGEYLRTRVQLNLSKLNVYRYEKDLIEHPYKGINPEKKLAKLVKYKNKMGENEIIMTLDNKIAK